MSVTPASAEALAGEIRAILDAGDSVGCVRAVVCPPYVSLETVARTLAGSDVAVGAQNLHPEPEGAFTGEISPQMVREFADFVIIGHSERRAHFSESDDFIARKVRAAFDVGLKPILCVGESISERRADDAERFVSEQLLAGLSNLDDLSELLVAYEPVWAIGTGETATPEIAQEMIGALRFAVRDSFGGDFADTIPFLYGGSVNAGNVAELVIQDDIDGALVGGASLAAHSFCAIVQNAAKSTHRA